MTDDELHELTPSDALDMWLSERAAEVRESTLQTNERRVGFFISWCQENGIEALSELDGMDIHKYRLSIPDDLSKRTLVSRLSDVRVFLRWARSIEAVKTELPDLIELPETERARTRTLDHDTAQAVLKHLNRFQYASREHVFILLAWDTAARLGALRGIDVGDYHTERAFVEFQHRPETDTPLKNGHGGERPVSLSRETCVVIDDYLQHKRIDNTDEYGRDPLFATKFGRMAILPLRRIVYRLTRPCVYHGECPHDREIDDCEAVNDNDLASRCPSTVSPHDIRRGRLTHLCRGDVPETVISDRSDVSPDVLEEHYNQMTDQEKMEQRRDYLTEL